ncbi:MAG: CehA/McbA family metallohydrolase [Clostridia bacterium]|nr:CehA/McbA family metallohydrolase [Clostridia bacterium]
MKKALALILSLAMVFCMLPIVASADSTPIGEVYAAVAGGSTATYTVTGRVAVIDGTGNIYLQDDTGGICTRYSSTPACNLGDTLTVTGTGYVYNGLPQLSSATLVGEVVAGDGPIDPVVVTIPELGNHMCQYVQLRGVEITEIYDNSGAYTNPNVTVTDGTNSVQVYRALMNKVDGEWEFQVGDKVNISAGVSIYNTTVQLRNSNGDEWEEYIELVAKPVITPDGGTVEPNSQVAITCATEGAELYYKIDNGEYSAYTAPIVLTQSCEISAYAQLGEAVSEIVTASFYVSDGSAMNIVEALAAGEIASDAKVYGQLVYRFGNYGALNSAILQYKHTDGEIYGLQVYNSLDSYTDATATPVEIGDWVVITGTLGAYGGVQQMQSLTAIEKAPDALAGEDVTAAQEYASLSEMIADRPNLLSEYVLIKNVKLGAYNSNGSTTVSDAANASTTTTIYRAADYTKWHAEGDVVDLYCVVSAYGSTHQLRNGSVADYVKTVPDTTGPVITLPDAFLDAQIDSDYLINVTVEDYSGVASVKISYTIGGNNYGPFDMTAGADNAFTYTIPAAHITGGSETIDFTITAVDKAAEPNTEVENGAIPLVDLPQIRSFAPESNYASGDDKRPVISFTFANAGLNPTIEMLINGEAVTPVISGDTASYQSATDMEDGKYTITARITRTDGKSVEQSWNFYVGEAQYAFYFGQLHSHTAQYSDGSGTLEQAFEYAKYQAHNVDFLAVTDHSNYFDTSSNLGDMTDPTKGTMTADGSQTLWQEALATTDLYNDETFVSIYGYEMTWSGQYGHINTFNTLGFESRNNSTYVVRNGPGLTAYYDRLVEVAAIDEEAGRTTSINQFNHPGTTFGTFEDFAHYSVAYDELITMIEVGNGEGKVGGSAYWPSYEYYTLALDKGWHLAPTNNQDNHKGRWGDSNTCRNVIYTDNFTREGIYEAMREMNMYATEDDDLEILYTLNDERMGTVLSLDESETLRIHVEFNDPTDRVAKVSIIANGGQEVASKSFGTQSGVWDVEIPNTYSYYYVRIDGADAQIAVTSPVWTKEVTKIGISSVVKDTVVDIIDDPITFTTTVYNYEQEELTVDSIRYYIDDALVYTADDNYTVAPETEDASAVWQYTPKAEGRFTLRVEVTTLLEEVEYNFTYTLTFTVRDGSKMKTMLIDGAHANFYVAGNYNNSDTAFIELAAEYGVRASRITETITDTTLEGCDLLVLTVPFRGASLALTDYLYTDDEIAAIKKYADNGGNIIITSKSDRLEPSSEDEWASNISNELLEAIGAKARIGKGIVADVVNNTNESYRLHFMGKEHYNFESDLCYGLPEMTNSMFSCYNGAPVILNGATPVVTAFDTTFVSSYADYYTGSGYMPDPDTEKSTYYYGACGDQEEIVVMAEETLPGGGFCITAGVTFFSTFEVKVEVENAGTLQNTNYQIVCNLFEMLNPNEITPISEIMEDGTLNQMYTIEGWVTSNASGYDQETAFFDCIYLQDESGRGINVFPVAGEYQIGQKLRITGTTASYMGEIELNVGNEYGGKVTDITIPYSERAELVDIDYTLADKQTIDTYYVDTARLQAVLDEVCSATKASLIEPAAGAANMETLADGTVQYVNQEYYFMDVVSCGRAMQLGKLGGLVEIYGTVTDIEYDGNGIIGTIYVEDETGTAIVFLDGYINCDCASCTLDAHGYHDLSGVAIGATIRVRGIASKGQNSYDEPERMGSRIRIRNRADIEVWEGNTPVAEDIIRYGDADLNKDVTAADASEILRYLVRLTTFNEEQMLLADVTGNGEIEAADAAKILRWIVRLIDTLEP